MIVGFNNEMIWKKELKQQKSEMNFFRFANSEKTVHLIRTNGALSPLETVRL